VIYVASSWRNTYQPSVVAALRAAGCETYDFRNPEPGNAGFAWSAIDKDWRNWTTPQFAEALRHPVAQAGFGFDHRAMERSNGCVIVLPCGKSAHIEVGWMAGAGKRTLVYVPKGEQTEPELMYLLCDGHVTDSLEDVLAWAARLP
jgi:hypothetical protein